MKFLYDLMEFVSKEIFEYIWILRCADMITFELQIGITDVDKKKPSKGSQLPSSRSTTSFNVPINHNSLYVEWINKSIELVFSWMDFLISLN